MSPNNKAYVAVTVHLEHEGVPLCLLLDIFDVLHSHTRINLAEEFVKLLEDFGIADKVSNKIEVNKRLRLTHSCQILSITCDNASANDAMITHLAELLPEFPGQA